MKTLFLISPVRSLDPEYENLICQLEHEFRKKDIKLYIPFRDTDQSDAIGYRICSNNRKAIEESDGVLILWKEGSQGSLFDLGMAFALRKPIHVVPETLPPLTREKSFQNMISFWEEYGASFF